MNRPVAPVRMPALVGGRFRVDGIIHQSPSSVIYDTTHRNGVRAWIKVPLAREHVDGIRREGLLANAIGTVLRVRDDGTGEDGLPYLVLEACNGESVASLLEKARAPLAFERAMRIGHSLASVIAAMNKAGFASGGLDADTVVAAKDGSVGLLALDGSVPSNEAGMLDDVRGVASLLQEMLTGKPRTASDPPLASVPNLPANVAKAISDVWTGTIRSVADFLVSLGGIGAPPVSGSEKLAKAMTAEAVPETPIAIQVPVAVERDSSIMAYLKSDEIMNVVAPPPAPRPVVKHEMRSPLTSSFELPRLVQAVAPPQQKKSGLSSRTIMLMVGAPLVLVVAGVSALAIGSNSAPTKTVSAAEPASKAAEPAAKASAKPVASAAPAVVDEALDLDEPKEAPSASAAKSAEPAPAATPEVKPEPKPESQAAPPADLDDKTGALRTENAPADRRVFVDGKVVGQTPLDIRLPCGSHDVKIGSSGASHTTNVPCGGVRIVRFDGGHIAWE